MNELLSFYKELYSFNYKCVECVNDFHDEADVSESQPSCHLMWLVLETLCESCGWDDRGYNSTIRTMKIGVNGVQQYLIISVHNNGECSTLLTSDDNHTHSYMMNSEEMEELKSQDHAADAKSYCSQTYMGEMQQNQLQPTTKETEAANVLMNLSGKTTERTSQEPQCLMNSQSPVKTCEHARYNQLTADSFEHLNEDHRTDKSICNNIEDYTKCKNSNEFKNDISAVTQYSNSLCKSSKEFSNSSKSIKLSTLNSAEINDNKEKGNLQEKGISFQQKELDIPVINKNALLPITTQIVCPICNHQCEDLVEVHEHILDQHNLSDGTHLSSSPIQLETSDAVQRAYHSVPQASSEIQQGPHPTTLQFSFEPHRGPHSAALKSSEIGLISQNNAENNKKCMGTQISYTNHESISFNKNSIMPYKDIENRICSQQPTIHIRNCKINKKNCKKKKIKITENLGVRLEDSQNKVANEIQIKDKYLNLGDSQDINIEISDKEESGEEVYWDQGDGQPPEEYIEEHNNEFDDIRKINNICKKFESSNSQSMNSKKLNLQNNAIEIFDSNTSDNHKDSIYNHESEELYPEKKDLLNEYIKKTKSMSKFLLQTPVKPIEPENILEKNTKIHNFNLKLFHDKEKPKLTDKSNKLLVRVVESSSILKDKARDALAMAVESSRIRDQDHRVSVSICLGCTTGFVGPNLILAHSCHGHHPLTIIQENNSVALTEALYTFNGDPALLNQENVWYFPDFIIRRVDNGTESISVEMIHSSSGRIFGLLSDKDVGSLCQNMFVFKCPKCCTEHDSLDKFLQHLVAGPCVFRCTQCTLMYNTPEKVEAHRTSVHPSVADRTCPRCNQVFEKRHLRNKHLAIKCSQQVVCQICGAVLKNKYNLMVHMNCHSERQHVCSECGKAFHRKGVLVRHMLKHQGHMPFECSTCNQRFYNKNKLQLHIDRHRGDRRHSCIYCDKRFYTKYDCDRHSKRYHLKKLGISFDTGKSKSRQIAIEQAQIGSQNIEQTSNTVIEKGQSQILSRIANVDIQSKLLCKQNKILNKLCTDDEQRKKIENMNESEKHLNNTTGNVSHRKIRKEVNIGEDDDPDDPVQ
ncbi:unnamed protein product, partial [Meganyctiphanes norvegica]